MQGLLSRCDTKYLFELAAMAGVAVSKIPKYSITLICGTTVAVYTIKHGLELGTECGTEYLKYLQVKEKEQTKRLAILNGCALGTKFFGRPLWSENQQFKKHSPDEIAELLKKAGICDFNKEDSGRGEQKKEEDKVLGGEGEGDEEKKKKGWFGWW